MREIARALIYDGTASRYDGVVLTRLVEFGSADRVALDAAVDEIEIADIPDAAKKSALRRLNSFFEGSATGIAADLFGAPAALMARFKWEGIDSGAELLEAAKTPMARDVLAQRVGSTEKEIRQLAKQADLQRVDGIDPKLAKVLVDLGIDSVVELAGRNGDNLHAKLKVFAGTQDSWIIKFKMPSDASASGSKTAKEKAAVAELVAQAEQLPRVLEFGRPTSGFAALPVEARLETLYSWDSNFSREDLDGPAAAFFESLGADAVVSELARMHADAMMLLQEDLSYWDVQVPQATLAGFGSYDDLLAHVSDDAAEALGNGWASFEPRVEVIKDGNEIIGALIRYDRNLDGDHGYGSTWVYDHTANKLIGFVEWGYERDTDFEIY
ncbi:MAG: DUF4332 domain-containing protein [Myxococcota bacterium]